MTPSILGTALSEALPRFIDRGGLSVLFLFLFSACPFDESMRRRRLSPDRRRLFLSSLISTVFFQFSKSHRLLRSCRRCRAGIERMSLMMDFSLCMWRQMGHNEAHQTEGGPRSGPRPGPRPAPRRLRRAPLRPVRPLSRHDARHRIK